MNMKKQAVIAAAAALALGLTAQANAQTAVYITGSTAFRTQTMNAVYALFDGGAPTNIVSRGGTDPHSATYAIVSGTIGGATHSFDIYTLWSGSEAGLAALSGTSIPDTDFNGNNDTIPNDVTYFLVPGISPATSANNPAAGETNTVAQTPDLSMADTSKNVSFSASANFTTFGSGATLSEVGIVPFTWAKCTNSAPFAAWSHLTNITHDQALVELGGAQVASFFTGVSNDQSVVVYAVGRNQGSGTRVNCLADTGYGIGNPVDQWAVNPTGATPGTFGPPFVAIGAVDTGIHNAYDLVEVVNAGFESGGNVSADLSIDGCSSANIYDPNSQTLNPAGAVITVGYLGLSDASKNSLGTNLWLTLNGVFESDDAVAQGQYSYWGYEHLYGKPGLGGSQLSYGQSLFTTIRAQVVALNNAPGKHNTGIALGYMQASKDSDLAFPTHN